MLYTNEVDDYILTKWNVIVHDAVELKKQIKLGQSSQK